MAGFLDQYGVADTQREKRRRIVIGSVLALVLIGAFSYFFFRTWSEERTVRAFLDSLSRQDFQGAYKYWGCSQDKPNYEPERFNEDWGPSTPYSNGSAAKVSNVDFCDTGVVFSLTYPNADPVSLWVERSTNVISFSPWPRCPGRHWEFRQFFRNLFSS
jgi:hypothetical protein